MSDFSSPHHKRRVRALDPDADPEFQIAPMIDILLVLLVFFMSISSTEVLQANKAINLPIAKEAKEAKENPGQIIVNIAYIPISNSSVIEVDQKPYPTPGDLLQLLDKKVRANPMLRVVIRADRQIRYEYLRNLLDVVGKAGVSNVTFSVVDKEQNPAVKAG